MKRMWMMTAAAVLACLIAVTIMTQTATAAERIEEATVVGKDRSKQAGTVPTDTRAMAPESKMKKEDAPTGLKTEAPGVRAQEKMEKPKMDEKDRQKPESKRRFGDQPIWIWILAIAAIAALAG